jgi:hypothetical protein
MPALVNNLTVSFFHRRLRGYSQPILVQASDGLPYVVKFPNNPQGPNLLFNEGVGSELFRACGLSVPAWKVLTVSEDFLDRNPDCWIQTQGRPLRPAAGLCFGSQFLGGFGKRIFEILPSSSFKLIRNSASFWLAWLIDVCAEHIDNRKAIFIENAEGWLDPFFVDHGCLFGGGNAESRRNVYAPRYLDPRIYPAVSYEALIDFEDVLQALDVDRLWQRLDLIPEEWVDASALIGFEACLQRLSMPLYTQSLLTTLLGSLERRTETSTAIRGIVRKPPSTVRRPGLQDAGFNGSFVHHPACA